MFVCACLLVLEEKYMNGIFKISCVLWYFTERTVLLSSMVYLMIQLRYFDTPVFNLKESEKHSRTNRAKFNQNLAHIIF